MSELLGKIEYAKDRFFEIKSGNLLNEDTDVIVNAANGMLSHGGGVAYAIASAAGDDLYNECNEYIRTNGRIPVTEVVLTTAGNLRFKGVIHAVGPRFGEGDEENKLVKTIYNAFVLANNKGFSSLAFPAVSSGIFSVPYDICARSYFDSVERFYNDYADSNLKLIRLVMFKGKILDFVLKEYENRIK